MNIFEEVRTTLGFMPMLKFINVVARVETDTTGAPLLEFFDTVFKLPSFADLAARQNEMTLEEMMDAVAARANPTMGEINRIVGKAWGSGDPAP